MSVWEILGIVLMPVTYGFVGWLTNTAALHMTLYPLEFVGIRPFFGWQGIVPRRAKKLALTAVKMLTTHVVRVEEFFARIKSRQLERMYAPVLESAMPGIVREELESLRLPTENTEAIAGAALQRSREGLGTLAASLETNAKGALNFRGLVIRRLTGENTKHLVHMFQTIGTKEFAFIRRSGWFFGGLLGLVQVGIWFLFPKWWTLPIQGALVGGVTNVLALWLIFRPLHERKLFGMRYQGLFLKRQAAVSELYGELFAKQILTPRAILEEVLHRPMARRVVDAVHASIESSTGTRPPEEDRARLTPALVTRFAEGARTMERLIERAMNVRKLIGDRMKEMSPAEFEPILRSAFREDEKILVVLGAVFGALIGLAQGLFMAGL